ncbi:MAG: PhoH family protein [bacterium]
MNKQQNKRLYVLDTNVLMHDPTSIFRFQEHDIFLPMTVIEELDRAKKGNTEISRNVRQVSRFLDQILADQAGVDLDNGIPISLPNGVDIPLQRGGKLYFDTLTTNKPVKGQEDNQILATTLHLSSRFSDYKIILVSKDINLRIKATIAGVIVEDYQNDKVLDDLNLLYHGYNELNSTFWQDQDRLKSWTESAYTYYQIDNDDMDLYPNQYLYINEADSLEAVVEEVGTERTTIRLIDDFRHKKHSVWGIMARNREQNFALNALMDPQIDFVTLMGTAGTGKTLLALAAGLAQCLDEKRYTEIIMTRATIPVAEDIGFLPGTEEEKMTPWMGALTDNLEFLTQGDENEHWKNEVTTELLSLKVKVRAMNFMRGRTFLNRYVIIDEAQNLTSKQMKTLLTRAGPGTKMICLGNVAQIDTPYLTETTSGLTYAVDRFKNWEHSAHVTLQRGERSRLADFASEVL